MDEKNNFLIIGLIVVLVIGVGAFFLFGQSKVEEPAPTQSPIDDVLTDLENQDNQQVEEKYTIEEVAIHDNKDDCWLAIEGGVYDATPFIASGEHPGKDAILAGCGIDATELYNTRPMGSGTAHSDQARALLADYLIGELVEEEENGGGVMGDETVIEDVTELKIEDVVVGKGDEAIAGKKVTVNYKGTLTNGEVFDSSYEGGKPFPFELGAGRVIQGWEEGVVGMKVGGKRVLIIPPDMAYGSQPNGAIPANSTLIFEVELLKVE